jgi:hypothetical protein
MKSLYDKSSEAMRRYWKDEAPAMSKIGRALQAAKREAYRSGWMIGYRAGKRAGLRQETAPERRDVDG